MNFLSRVVTSLIFLLQIFNRDKITGLYERPMIPIVLALSLGVLCWCWPLKKIPHRSMYDIEKHVLSSCQTSSNSTLVSEPNWRDWWREVVFQRSRSIEKNNIVFLLFTNCTILKKAKKSPLALTLFDHVPKRKSGICYCFNGGRSRLIYQLLDISNQLPLSYT